MSANPTVGLGNPGTDSPRESRNVCPASSAVALGTILMLGGLFATLAMHRLLPISIDSLNRSGSFIRGLVYASLPLGLLITTVGVCVLSQRKEGATKSQRPGITGDSDTQRESITEADYEALLSEERRLLSDLGLKGDISMHPKLLPNFGISPTLLSGSKMRGVTTNNMSDGPNPKVPFVAIKMRCVHPEAAFASYPAELIGPETQNPYLREKLVILYPHDRENSSGQYLMQEQHLVAQPRFLSAPYPRGASKCDDAEYDQGVKLLKECIAKGRGVDLDGNEWVIVEGSSTPVVAEDVDKMIPEPIKAALTKALGKGLPDIPCCEREFLDLPWDDELPHSIMKGLIRNPDTFKESKPFIALKLRCESSRDEIGQELGVVPRQLDESSLRETKVFVFYPYQNQASETQAWGQNEGSLHPTLFSDLVKPDAVDESKKGFARVKSLIEGSTVEDSRSLKWVLISDESE